MQPIKWVCCFLLLLLSTNIWSQADRYALEFPEHDLTIFTTGDVLLEQHDYEGALVIFEQLLKKELTPTQRAYAISRCTKLTRRLFQYDASWIYVDDAEKGKLKEKKKKKGYEILNTDYDACYKWEQFLLPQTKNYEFQTNFTHPLNYLCLLDEPLLRHYIHTLDENNMALEESTRKKIKNIKKLFGFENKDKELKYNLKQIENLLCAFWRRKAMD